MKVQSKFKLPEKWYVFYPEEEFKTIVKFLNWKNKPTTKEGYLSTHDNESYGLSPLNLYKGYTELSFDQFKEHVLKEIPKPEYEPKDVAFKNDVYSKSEFNSETFETKCGHVYTENKRVIGYKLIKPEYWEAVKCIINNDWFKNFDSNMIKKGFNFAHVDENDICVSTSIHYKIKKSGVLYLWFEPVYETSTEEKIINYLSDVGVDIGKEKASNIIKIVTENENRIK